MRRMYIHQQPDPPRLRWDYESVSDTLATVRYEQGRLIGRMAAWGSTFGSRPFSKRSRKMCSRATRVHRMTPLSWRRTISSQS